MIFKETLLKGAFLVEVKQLEDTRGFFGRAWCQQEFEENGLNGNIRQIIPALKEMNIDALDPVEPPPDETNGRYKIQTPATDRKLYRRLCQF